MTMVRRRVRRIALLVLTVSLLLPALVSCAAPRLADFVGETRTEEPERQTKKAAEKPAPTTRKRDVDMTEYPFPDIAGSVTLLGERTNVTEEGLALEWACSGFEMALETEGTDLALRFAGNHVNYFKVIVDGEESPARLTVTGNSEVTAVRDLAPGTHVVRVIKDSQPDLRGGMTLTSVSFNGTVLPHPKQEKSLYLEFFGDSIWAGVGALGNQGSSPNYGSEISATVATPYRAVTALDADYNITARGSIGVTRPVGDLVASQLFSRLNGFRDETPYEPRRAPDAVIICLGANDPIAEASAFVEGGKALIRQIRDTYGDGTKIIWTNGMFSKTKFIDEIQTILAESGGEEAGLYYLQMIYGQNGSGSKDSNRHPSASDHEKNAELLIPFLREILGLS